VAISTHDTPKRKSVHKCLFAFNGFGNMSAWTPAAKAWISAPVGQIRSLPTKSCMASGQSSAAISSTTFFSGIFKDYLLLPRNSINRLHPTYGLLGSMNFGFFYDSQRKFMRREDAETHVVNPKPFRDFRP
jgi:hypothetical protein